MRVLRVLQRPLEVAEVGAGEAHHPLQVEAVGEEEGEGEQVPLVLVAAAEVEVVAGEQLHGWVEEAAVGER